ncbi:hypothetical protein BKN38_00985 [Helicobacter sp. CLO-3]|nr:hypothetical protein BA723_06580 [Helicobacter sp. CLO-3]OHU85624.1 hypothetical protein BKN38_00985 [Helicobacter sp. CLO-3]
MLNNELNILLTTLIAGLFGFTIAIVPFAIQVLSKNNIFIDKLRQKDNFDQLIKPIFIRHISFLQNMFRLFVFLLLLSIFKNSICPLESHLDLKKFFMIIVSEIYIYLIACFLKSLLNS